MALEHEKRRILDRVQGDRRRLDPLLTQLKDERKSTEEFVGVTGDILEILCTELGPQLDSVVDPLSSISADIASELLSDLSAAVDGLVDLLASIAANQNSIPREMYGVLDWFFEKCRPFSKPPNYIVSISPVLSTLDLRQIARSLFSRRVLGTTSRDYIPQISQYCRNNPLFIIFVPGTVVSTHACLDWSLILHECGHAIDQLNDFIGSVFPSLPKDLVTLNEMSKAGDLNARNALWSKEMLCDSLASEAIGPAFPWRFIRQYYSVGSVFHLSYSHPRVDVRMKRLTDRLRFHGFTTEADSLDKLANDLVVDATAAAAPLTLPNQAAALIDQLANQIEPVTAKKLQDFARVNFNSWPRELRDSVVRLKPVIAEPSILFALTACDAECEAQSIQTVLADFLRLSSIENRYRQLGLSG